MLQVVLSWPPPGLEVRASTGLEVDRRRLPAVVRGAPGDPLLHRPGPAEGLLEVDCSKNNCSKCRYRTLQCQYKYMCIGGSNTENQAKQGDEGEYKFMFSLFFIMSPH